MEHTTYFSTVDTWVKNAPTPLHSPCFHKQRMRVTRDAFDAWKGLCDMWYGRPAGPQVEWPFFSEGEPKWSSLPHALPIAWHHPLRVVGWQMKGSAQQPHLAVGSLGRFRSCGGITQIHVVGCRGGGGALVREGNQLLDSPALPVMAFTVLCFHHTALKQQRKGHASGFF